MKINKQKISQMNKNKRKFLIINYYSLIVLKINYQNQCNNKFKEIILVLLLKKINKLLNNKKYKRILLYKSKNKVKKEVNLKKV